MPPLSGSAVLGRTAGMSPSDSTEEADLDGANSLPFPLLHILESNFVGEGGLNPRVVFPCPRIWPATARRMLKLELITTLVSRGLWGWFKGRNKLLTLVELELS